MVNELRKERVDFSKMKITKDKLKTMTIPSAYQKFTPDNTNLKIECGPGKERPAWIYVEGLPPKTGYIKICFSLDIPRKTYGYYLTPRVPLFIPLDYTKDELRLYYDRLAKLYDKCVPDNAKDAEFLFTKIAPKNKDAKILELGCGTGFGATQFAINGYANLTLTDYSKELLEEAKRKDELQNYKFIHENLNTLTLKEKFDLIFSLHSFGVETYFTEKDMFVLFKKVAGWLKPGGKLAILDYFYEPPSNLYKLIEKGVFGTDPSATRNWGLWQKK